MMIKAIDRLTHTSSAELWRQCRLARIPIYLKLVLLQEYLAMVRYSSMRTWNKANVLCEGWTDISIVQGNTFRQIYETTYVYMFRAAHGQFNIITQFGTCQLSKKTLLHLKLPLKLFLTDPIHTTYPSLWSVGGGRHWPRGKIVSRPPNNEGHADDG